MTALCFNTNQFLVLPYFLIKHTYARIANLLKYIEKIYKKEDLILVGPAPETVAKVQDYYKMVLYMRHENREILVRLKDALEKYIAVNKGFQDIYIQFDFNV